MNNVIVSLGFYMKFCIVEKYDFIIPWCAVFSFLLLLHMQFKSLLNILSKGTFPMLSIHSLCSYPAYF